MSQHVYNISKTNEYCTHVETSKNKRDSQEWHNKNASNLMVLKSINMSHPIFYM